MSEHFRKDAPHYEFSTVRIRLDEWLEDRSSGTLFGPKGCGKDTFLKDYFTPKKNRALAADTNKPTIVLVWEGTTLRHRKDLDDLLACAFQEGFSYLKEQGLIEQRTGGTADYRRRRIRPKLRAGMEKTAVLLCIGRPGLSQFYLQYRWLPGRQYPAGKHLEKLRCSLADDRNERLPLHRTVLPRHGGSGRLVDLQ